MKRKRQSKIGVGVYKPQKAKPRSELYSTAGEEIKSEPEKGKVLRERGLVQAKKFSWPESAEKLLAIFNSFS